jgi:hypothetical protein
MWVNDARKFKYYRLMENNEHSDILKNTGINKMCNVFGMNEYLKYESK